MPHWLRPTRAAIVIVPLTVWAVWLVAVSVGGGWTTVAENWLMALTMCAGSFIAGATSEGGGAVAFPVMTLVFGIEPAVARDFCLMIQAVGMTAAAILIFWLRIRIEWRAVVFAGLGGAVGIIVGLRWIAPLVPAACCKMLFTSLWLSFAMALFWINRRRNRLVLPSIPDPSPAHAALFVGVGLLGGIVSSLTGSGLDIITFTLLTLFFRINEKVATPTSVVLMASNALVGTFYSGLVTRQLAAEAFGYWYACVPVVVVGAPLGAYFIRARSRHLIARFLYISILCQFVAATVIIPLTRDVVLTSILTLLGGLLLFAAMARGGATVASRFTQARARDGHAPQPVEGM
jgi:uncharacterized membrane protein YfcA